MISKIFPDTKYPSLNSDRSTKPITWVDVSGLQSGENILPLKPKPRRIHSKETLDIVLHRRDGTCMVSLSGVYGSCSAGLDPHHIVPRGAGGDDVPENLITLCRHHHNLVQTTCHPYGALWVSILSNSFVS
jgi:hypothetical protein